MSLACLLISEWESASKCQADGNIDGKVNIEDVLGVIGAWSGSEPTISFFDVTGLVGEPDGLVNITDLLFVIDTWSGDKECAKNDLFVGSDCLYEYAIDCP